MLDLLKASPIWTTWRREVRKGKSTKVPYQIDGRLGSSTAPSAWATFDECQNAPNKDGVGIVFEQSCGVIGIDFDHCLTPEDVPAWLDDFLTLCDSHCEYSPSKTGCHVLFQTDERPEILTHKHYFSEDQSSHVEIYVTGRYFTFTDDEMPQSKPIRKLSANAFIELLQRLGYPWAKQDPTPTKTFDLPLSPAFDDDTLLKKMFAAKNGEKIKALWSGDLQNHNNDASSADHALCIHLAFWTRKDPQAIERLWLLSPLGQREKTQQRKDYRDRTIENACEATSEIYQCSKPLHITTDAGASEEVIFLMSFGKNPVPLLICNNIVTVLKSDPYFKNVFRKNEFSHLTESCLLQQEWLPLTDDVIGLTREFIVDNYPDFRKASKDIVTDAIMRAAYSNKVNPPRDYFSSLIWDKTPRLNSWLFNAYGVADDELHQAIGSNWLKGLVKRVMIPGCQFDEVLALESPQGWRKSSSIRALGEPWHVETTHSIENKDFYLTLAQNIIVEFSEGDVFDRNSVKKLKAEITKTEDQVRPPYERGIVKFKRSCVFAVTTNQLELKDDTGNRRWLPVSLEKPADIEWIKTNRDQLFAEAYYRVIIMKETTHEYPKESLENLQSSRAETSVYDEKAIDWYAGLQESIRESGISLKEAIDAIFGTVANITRVDELRISAILRRALELDNKNKKINGAVLRRWMPTDRTRRLLTEYKSSTYARPSSF
jgi:predicted P-loop ATPase